MDFFHAVQFYVFQPNECALLPLCIAWFCKIQARLLGAHISLDTYFTLIHIFSFLPVAQDGLALSWCHWKQLRRASLDVRRLELCCLSTFESTHITGRSFAIVRFRMASFLLSSGALALLCHGGFL